MIKTTLEAVEYLSECDHAFLDPSVVKMIVEPFGFNPKEFLYKERDSRSQPKGLYVPSVKEGDWVEGSDAAVLASKLCRNFGVEYRSMFGRGSALRECCRALKEYCEHGM